MAGSIEQSTVNGANERVHTIDGETLPVRSDERAPEFDAVDALSRLLVGGAADASDLLVRLLEQWQNDIVAQNQATIVEDEEDAGDILRYMLIGLMFESQHAVRSSLRNAGSLIIGATNVTASVTRPLRKSFLFAPFQATAERASHVLEDRILSLVQTGRNEEFVGRLMAENALQETVDWIMDYVAENPAIRELVQEQALGFSEEVTIGVRERAITADNAVDALLRKLFRRKPREILPGPPNTVKEAELRQDLLEQGWTK